MAGQPPAKSSVCFQNSTSDYAAYFDAFIKIGGRPGYQILLLYFSPSALSALQVAESLRESLGQNESLPVSCFGVFTNFHAAATGELLAVTPH